MIKILAVETSCDDTAIAIVDSSFRVHANLISSQATHADFGGVVPELASRLHIRNIMPLTQAALLQAECSLKDITALAVSVNPGLIGALLVGVSFAKGLAYSLGIPLIAVNHMIGHVCANKIEYPELEPPFLALIVSGGHTEIVYFKTYTNFNTVGRTLDDAAGEAFDKAAKLLQLGYPGGPLIDDLARHGNPDFVDFPRALPEKKNFDFSFSGFKTAVRNFLQQNKPDYIQEYLPDIAASIQKAIVDALVSKTIRYAHYHRLNKIIVAGGVSANSLLRQMIIAEAGKIGARVYIPRPEYCMDNAAMIGAAAVIKYQQEEFADLDLNAFSTKGVRNI